MDTDKFKFLDILYQLKKQVQLMQADMRRNVHDQPFLSDREYSMRVLGQISDAIRIARNTILEKFPEYEPPEEFYCGVKL